MIPWWNTEFGEEEKIEMLKAFSEKRFTVSKSVERVEKMFSELLDVPYTLLTNSGSSALLMAFLSLDLKPGEEIIAPALTWIATAQAPALLGGTVVLCDCLDDQPIIDCSLIQRLITEKTKVILPVHLNGRACDISTIRSLAQAVDAYVIEDSCKGMFSKNSSGYLGTLGDIGCFSLGMISPISIGYGGMVVTKKRSLYEKLKKIRDHGVEREPERYRYLGFNFKISDLLASLAIPQLIQAEERKKKLLAIHNLYAYNVCLDGFSILPVDKMNGGIPVYVEARSVQREEIIAYLNAHDVQVSRFHLPLHQASYLRPQGSFPHASRFAQECFILPSGPAQSFENIEKVIELLNKFSLCGV